MRASWNTAFHLSRTIDRPKKSWYGQFCSTLDFFLLFLWVLEVLLLVDFLTYITTLLVHTTFCFFFFPWNETFLVVAAASAWLNKSTSSKYRLFYTQQLQNFLYFLSSQKYILELMFYLVKGFLKDSKVKTQQERKWKEVTTLM